MTHIPCPCLSICMYVYNLFKLTTLFLNVHFTVSCCLGYNEAVNCLFDLWVIHLLLLEKYLWWLITVCLFDSCCRCWVIHWHGAWRSLYNTWCDALRCLPCITLAAPYPAVSDTRTSTENLLHMRRPCTRILCGRRGRLSGLYTHITPRLYHYPYFTNIRHMPHKSFIHILCILIGTH